MVSPHRYDEASWTCGPPPPIEEIIYKDADGQKLIAGIFAGNWAWFRPPESKSHLPFAQCDRWEAQRLSSAGERYYLSYHPPYPNGAQLISGYRLRGAA